MSVGASDRAQKYAAFLEQFGVPYADEIAQLVAKHTVDYHGDIREVLNWIVDNVDRSLNKGEILRQVEDYLSKLNGSSLKLEMDNLDQLYYEKSYYENLLSELEYMDLTPEEREAMEKEIKNQLAHIKAKIIKLEEKRRKSTRKRRPNRESKPRPKPKVEVKPAEPKPIEEEVIELELTPIREIELPNVEEVELEPEPKREEIKELEPELEPKPRVEPESRSEEVEPRPELSEELGVGETKEEAEPKPELGEEAEPRVRPRPRLPEVDISEILRPVVSLEKWLTRSKGVGEPKPELEPKPRPKAKPRVMTDKLFLDEGLGVRVWLRDDGIAFVYCEDPRVSVEPYVEKRRGRWRLKEVKLRVNSHTHGPITLWVGR